MLFPKRTSRNDINADDKNDNLEQTYLMLTDVKVGDEAPTVIGVFPLERGESVETPPIEEPSSCMSASPSWRMPKLVNGQWDGSFARPTLKGYRIIGQDDSHPISDTLPISIGGDWSPKFLVSRDPVLEDGRLLIEMQDPKAGLRLVFECESLPGGPLRMRYRLENQGHGLYVVEALEIRIPLPDDFSEILDFTGRHERERTPQRRRIADGTWIREGRRGKPSFEGTAIIAGTRDFRFNEGIVIQVQAAWSGNTVLAVDRSSEDSAAVHAGELLMPGEIALHDGEWYETPWVVVTASNHGLDGVVHGLHRWQRQLPSHPEIQPVTLNVWEAVYMNHSFEALADIASRAAALGVERFVLDDGWFHLRRDDHAGLGDWWVDPEVWPQGLTPLVNLVHELDMEFGLWFEPEMINKNSDTFREHPEWMLQTDGRMPLPHRHQQVLDLTNPAAYAHVLNHMSRVLEEYPIDYVKWDHNRDLLEAGGNRVNGAPVVHRQTHAFYKLLDELRSRFPKVVWESCASGGGRIDMGVVEHVSRFWPSDVTDALSRQRIQRWTVQDIAPEYIGAHVSAPTSHQTQRTYSLDFRAATAVFYSFGIEWDIRQASPSDLERLRKWISWYKQHRAFLHAGNVMRLDCGDPSVYAYGVVNEDASFAVVAHVQMDESTSNRGLHLCIPHLKPDAQYLLRWTGPVVAEAALEKTDSFGPIGEKPISGAMLMRRGIWIPRCRPQTVRLIEINEF